MNFKFGVFLSERWRVGLRKCNVFCYHVPGLLKIVSAVLHLGNMSFKKERNSDQASMSDDTGFTCFINMHYKLIPAWFILTCHT